MHETIRRHKVTYEEYDEFLLHLGTQLGWPKASVMQMYGMISIFKLVEERGICLLLASHLLDQVQSVCDRVGIFAAGRMIGLGTVPALARQFGDGTARIEVGVEADPASPAPVARILSGTPGVVSFDPDPNAPDTWIVKVSPVEALRSTV